MVMEFSGRNNGQDVRQCKQATKQAALAPSEDCCQGARDCDVPGWPIFESFNFNFSTTDHQPLGWDILVKEIKGKRPFCFTLKWTESVLGKGTGHMVVVRGYEIDADGKKWVHIIDPEPIPNPDADDAILRRGGHILRIRYEDYIENKTPRKVSKEWGGYTHWNDYFSIKPKS